MFLILQRVRLRHRFQQARKAEEWIRELIREPIPILRLCEEIVVSRRQIEYAFRTAFDVGPRDSSISFGWTNFAVTLSRLDGTACR
jgi:AraC family ethanolamine operon transcriptional activator